MMKYNKQQNNYYQTQFPVCSRWYRRLLKEHTHLIILDFDEYQTRKKNNLTDPV